MGETHSVTMNSETPTGPDAPNAPAIEHAVLGADGRVSLPTDPNVESEPVEDPEQPQNSDKPAWLDDKFETPEDLAKAYAELQARLGQAQTEPEVAEVTEESGVTPKALEPFAEEYYSTGEISEDSFAKLEKMGLGRDLVTAFMEGQKAVQAQELNTLYSQVGGEEVYSQALAWAAQNMTAEEISAYNDQVESGDMTTATMAVKGLMAQYQQGSGIARQPALLATEPKGPSGIAPYESVAQLMIDMKSKEYKTDPAFRNKVQERLSRSDII